MTDEQQEDNMDKIMALAPRFPVIAKHFNEVQEGKLEYGEALELIVLEQAKQIETFIATYRRH